MKALTLALVTGCGLTPYKPWPTHAAPAAKPASPLVAPADAAMLVVLLEHPQGSGNGGYTVFERRDRAVPVMQFGQTMAGWTAIAQPPGLHHYYLRTWTSDFCIRVDADLAAGKTYILGVNMGDGSEAHILTAAGMVEAPKPPAGALAYYPYVTFDAAAAQRELDGHAGQVKSCIAHADKLFAEAKGVAAGQPYDAIEFELHAANEGNTK